MVLERLIRDLLASSFAERAVAMTALCFHERVGLIQGRHGLQLALVGIREPTSSCGENLARGGNDALCLIL